MASFSLHLMSLKSVAMAIRYFSLACVCDSKGQKDEADLVLAYDTFAGLFEKAPILVMS